MSEVSEMSEMKAKIRKIAVFVEETHREAGREIAPATRKAVAVAVIENPFAGRYEPDIQPFIEDLRPLGLAMAQRLVAILGGAERIEGYGKGALIGAAGELEHGAL